MKKKKIISLISSILCSIAIVGLFCLGSLVDDCKQNKLEVSASMSLTDLTNTDVSFVSDNVSTFYPSMYTFLTNNTGDYDITTNSPHYYDFDYYVNGYANGNLFERIRVRVQYTQFSTSSYYSTQVHFYYGTNSDFLKWDNAPPGTTYSMYEFGAYGYANYDVRPDFTIISANKYDSLIYISTINFVNGNDINNINLLYLLNLCCNYVGLNTYTVDNLTASQYQDMINSLNDEIDILQGKLDSLTTQVEGAYFNGYYDAKEYYEIEYQNNMHAQYLLGYDDGYNDGFNVDTTATTIFNGILTVSMVPINFFLSIFNFEILGINLSYFIKALFTVMLVLIVVKVVIGNAGGSE